MPIPCQAKNLTNGLADQQSTKHSWQVESWTKVNGNAAFSPNSIFPSSSCFIEDISPLYSPICVSCFTVAPATAALSNTWMRMAGAQRSDWNAGVIIMVSNLYPLIGSSMKPDFFLESRLENTKMDSPCFPFLYLCIGIFPWYHVSFHIITPFPLLSMAPQFPFLSLSHVHMFMLMPSEAFSLRLDTFPFMRFLHHHHHHHHHLGW